MAHKHSVYDTDEHLSIIPALRKINGVENIRLVRGDHNSTRVTFDMPRFVDGHDMAETSIVEIHYINISADAKNTNEDVYIASDVQISPDSDDVVIFSWLISGNATKYDGTLSFMLCFKCLTGEALDYSWRTETAKGVPVLASLDCTPNFDYEVSDIIASWESRIKEIQGGFEQCANAIKATASGAKVTLTDISPLTHTPRVQLRSRNLIPFPYTFSTMEKNGITATVNADGSITINGTATANADFGLYNSACYLTAGTYGVLCVGATSGVYLLGELYNGSSWITGISDITGNGKSFTLTDENVANATRLYICILVKSGATVNNLTLCPMIAKDTIPTEYTPYITDFSGMTLKRYGATESELLETYTANADGTINGVTSIYPTMTLEADDSATVEVEYNRDLQGALDGKLDKVTETYWWPRLYSVSASGIQQMMPYHWTAQQETLALRTTGGALAVGNPMADAHAVPLGYANEHYLTKVTTEYHAPRAYAVNAKGEQVMYNMAWGASVDSVALRTTGGALMVGAPFTNNHAATKKYVDDAVANAGGGFTIIDFETDANNGYQLQPNKKYVVGCGDSGAFANGYLYLEKPYDHVRVDESLAPFFTVSALLNDYESDGYYNGVKLKMNFYTPDDVTFEIVEPPCLYGAQNLKIKAI